MYLSIPYVCSPLEARRVSAPELDLQLWVSTGVCLCMRACACVVWMYLSTPHVCSTLEARVCQPWSWTFRQWSLRVCACVCVIWVCLSAPHVCSTLEARRVLVQELDLQIVESPCVCVCEREIWMCLRAHMCTILLRLGGVNPGVGLSFNGVSVCACVWSECLRAPHVCSTLEARRVSAPELDLQTVESPCRWVLGQNRIPVSYEISKWS